MKKDMSMVVALPLGVKISLRHERFEQGERVEDHFFSMGGKKVVIKAVLQAIPSYVMHFFKLPASLITVLHRLAANFLWGSSAETRNMHWGSWDKLCLRKENGGLEFRDLAWSIKDLLAKSL